MDVILKMKIAGIGNVGDMVSMTPARAKRNVMGGLARYAKNVEAETEYDMREMATMKIAEKRNKPRPKPKKKKD